MKKYDYPTGIIKIIIILGKWITIIFFSNCGQHSFDSWLDCVNTYNPAEGE